MTWLNAHFDQTVTCPAFLSAESNGHVLDQWAHFSITTGAIFAFPAVQDRNTEVADQIWTVHKEDVVHLCAQPRSG